MTSLRIGTSGDCGLRIDPKDGWVDVGMTWDSAERMVFKIDPDVLLEIAQEAIEWAAHTRRDAASYVKSLGAPKTWSDVVGKSAVQSE